MTLNIRNLFKSQETETPTIGTDLHVPFEENNLAKKAGAKWDPQKKSWYAPAGSNLDKFRKWMIVEHQAKFNFKADSFFIAEAHGRCWSCSKNSRFISIGFYPGFLENKSNIATPRWVSKDIKALLYYVIKISDSASHYIQSLSNRYKIGYSHTAKKYYWMNHCDHCNAKQGDWHV